MIFDATPRARSFHLVKNDLKMLISSLIPLSRNQYYRLFNKTKLCIDQYLPYLSKKCEFDLYPYARTALYCLIKSLNLPNDSEVIISGSHITPYLNIIRSLNLKPVIVDIEQNTFCIDKDSLKSCITSKTKIVIITYLFGLVPDIRSILSCIPKDTFIIEDISQSIGAKNSDGYLGNFGNASIISTSFGKYIDGSGGAILFIKNKFDKKLVKSSKNSVIKKSNFLINFKRQYRPALLNILTSSKIYPFLHIIITFLERFNILSFKRFGASKNIQFKEYKPLPNFYFQEISPHSMRFIIDELPKLNSRISYRLNQVETVFKGLDPSYGFKADKLQNDADKGIINTYWQLVIKAPTNKTRSKLLPLGIETSCTNLSNLFDFLTKSEHKNNSLLTSKEGTSFLYKNTIFFPLSENISSRKLKKNLNIFNSVI